MGRLGVHARRELIFLALAVMETCVLAPLLAALFSLITSTQVEPLQVGGIFLGAVLAVHYLVRGSLCLPLYSYLRFSLLGLSMLVSGLLVVHRLFYVQTSLWNPAWLVDVFRGLQRDELSFDLLVFLVVLFLWWRGLVLAQRRLESGTVVSRFRSGIVMLAITTIVSGFILPSPPYRFVFAYFFVSLLGIALARAEEVGHEYGGSQAPFGLGWLVMVVSAAIVVLLLAAGVATLLTGENVSRFIGPVLEVQRVVFYLLTYVLVYAMSWVGSAVVEFLEGILGDLDFTRMGRALGPPNLGPPTQPGEPPFTPEQVASARVAGITVLLLLLIIVLVVRRLRLRAGRRRDEDRESVWREVSLRRSLRDMLADGRRRLGQMADALGHSYLGRIFAALTIRRIYAHLSGMAAELGYPRALHETPYEYQPTLEQAFPDYLAEVASITQAYVAVHYGEVPERAEDLEAIRASWERVRKTAASGGG